MSVDGIPRSQKPNFAGRRRRAPAPGTMAPRHRCPAPGLPMSHDAVVRLNQLEADYRTLAHAVEQVLSAILTLTDATATLADELSEATIEQEADTSSTKRKEVRQ